MIRYRSNFFFVWGVLAGLALLGAIKELPIRLGFSDLNTLSWFIVPYVAGGGMLMLIFALIKVLFFRSPHLSFRQGAPGIGRTARCHQCKRTLLEYTGSNCQFCGWIRCDCGACGCSIGKLS